jgi:DNA-directed RNA polymerase subunit L
VPCCCGCLRILRVHRITYQEDQKIADAGTFTLLKEDHTLGNIIRMSVCPRQLQGDTAAERESPRAACSASAQAHTQFRTSTRSHAAIVLRMSLSLRLDRSLLADGRVLFAGYRMPHPLENRMIIKVKTRPGYK